MLANLRGHIAGWWAQLARVFLNGSQASIDSAVAHSRTIFIVAAFSCVDIWVTRWLLTMVSCWDESFSSNVQSWFILHLLLAVLGLVAVRGLFGPESISRSLKPGRRQLPGTAAWLSSKKAGRIFGRSYRIRGIFFGRLGWRPVILPEKCRGNRNVTVIGPPGSMKSRAYIRNNILQSLGNGWSMLITDPKGELARDFQGYLETAGYEVRILNLVDLPNSHQWNPLQEIQDDEDVQMIAEAIITNTQSENVRSDPFWERAEFNLLKALLYLVTWKPVSGGESWIPECPATLESVYRILCSGSIEAMERFFAKIPATHPARPPYLLFKIASHNVQSSVIAGLGIRLQLFQIPAVCRLTCSSSIDTALPGQQPCAYFCIIPDTGRTYHFLSSLFLSFLIQRLMRQADERGAELAVPVCALLDEFCNIGKIPDFIGRLSTMRSRSLFCSLIVQSLVQLKEMYGEAFEIILAQCDSWLILGVNDYTTAEYISGCIGDTCRSARSYGRRAMKVMDFGSISSRDEARRLISPDELRRLPAGTALLLSQGQNPLKLKKMDYTNHPMTRLNKASTPEAASASSWAGTLAANPPGNGDKMEISSRMAFGAMPPVICSTGESGSGTNDLGSKLARRKPAQRPVRYDEAES